MSSLSSMNPIQPTDQSAACSFPSCQKLSATQRCGKCREAIYCNQACQRGDWPRHKTVCRTPPNRDLASLINTTYQIVFKGDPVKNIGDVKEIIVAYFHGSFDADLENTHEIHKILKKGDMYAIEGLACMKPYPGSDSNQTFQLLGWDFIEGKKITLDQTPKFWDYVERDSWYQKYGTDEERTVSLRDPNRNQYYKKAEEFWEKRQTSLMETLKKTAEKRSSGSKTVLAAGFDHLFKNPLRPFTHRSVQKVIDFLSQRNAIVVVSRRNEPQLVLKNSEYPPIEASSKRGEEMK